jgi:hypothetical protein
MPELQQRIVILCEKLLTGPRFLGPLLRGLLSFFSSCMDMLLSLCIAFLPDTVSFPKRWENIPKALIFNAFSSWIC